jgi:hypothetical protein
VQLAGDLPRTGALAQINSDGEAVPGGVVEDLGELGLPAGRGLGVAGLGDAFPEEAVQRVTLIGQAGRVRRVSSWTGS